MDGLDSGVPEAPEGWIGPFRGYYLWKVAGVHKTYKDFSEAVAAAEQQEGCAGITMTPTGRFSLRKMDGGTLMTDHRGEQCSWVKGDGGCTVCDEDLVPVYGGGGATAVPVFTIEQHTLNVDALEKQWIEETAAVEKAENRAKLAVQQEDAAMKRLETAQMAYAQAVESNRISSEVLAEAKNQLGETRHVLADARGMLRLRQLEEKRRLLKQAHDAQKEARRLAEQQQEALFLKQMAELDAEAGEVMQPGETGAA